MSSVMKDSDLVVIVETKLDQAALGWSLVASEERSEGRVKDNDCAHNIC